MVDVELAYLAGVIDSDGCIGIVHRFYARTGRDYFHPRVTIKQVTTEAINLAERRLGGHTFLQKPVTSTRRPLYRWEVSAEAAHHALTALLPFLRIKREQALNCIALTEARGTRARKGIPRGLPILSIEDEARLRVFYERAKELNRVGVHSTDTP